MVFLNILFIIYYFNTWPIYWPINKAIFRPYIKKKNNMKDGKQVLMGLDVSTACIGISIIIDDGSQYGKIVELTHINPKVSSKIKGIEQLFLKKKIFQEFLIKYKDFGIDEVIIEEPLMRSNNIFTV